MKVGDMIESAIWTTGEESDQIKEQHRQYVNIAIDRLCDEKGFLHGPVMLVEKRPEEDRVPPVPDSISGPKVRLLVAEAAIVGMAPQTSEGSFIGNLEKKDLERLRMIVRQARIKHGQILSDAECDSVIEEIGPEAALDTLRREVVVSQYH